MIKLIENFLLKQQEAETEEVDEKAGGSSITDYLTAPRKKRKNYVILAFGDKFDHELSGSIDQFVKATFPQLATSLPKTPADLKRQMGRNINLLLINDEFSELKEVLELIKLLKEKRYKDGIPVLFLTRDPSSLVQAYHDQLLAFHEADDFIYYPGMSRQQIFSQVKRGIETKNQRKSRRYLINIPITFYHLTKDKELPGKLVDLSVHGALIEGNVDFIFKIGDQLKIKIPISGMLSSGGGEFLKVSAKVRRVHISGSTVGVSFEHVSDSQIYTLTRFLVTYVNTQSKHKHFAWKRQQKVSG